MYSDFYTKHDNRSSQYERFAGASGAGRRFTASRILLPARAGISRRGGQLGMGGGLEKVPKKRNPQACYALRRNDQALH